MKKYIILFSFVFLILLLSLFVSAVEINPMIMRNIKEIKSVEPKDVANLGFGVYQVSATYNLGAYQQGKWMGFENKNPRDIKTGAVWVEFGWERPETNVVLIDSGGNERKIYLPASTPQGNSTYGEYYWIAEDGSSYYATKSHIHGWPDLTSEQALVPEHLARKSLSTDQKNPTTPEPIEPTLEESGNLLKIKGKLLDQMTGSPITGAKLESAYRFTPEEVITDSDGNFEFYIASGMDGSWNFYAACYGWAGAISAQKNREVWENGQIIKKYDFSIIKGKFDSKDEIIEDKDKKEVDIGTLYAWPSADISSVSDIEASYEIKFKYKNQEGYNGGGNGNFIKEHYTTNGLPLDYDVYIEFKDKEGKTYKSTTYHTPLDAKCGVVMLKYFNGESSWSLLSKSNQVKPTIETGPVEVDVPETVVSQKPDIVKNICSGCFKDSKCYPIGFRKSGEYCSDSQAFVSQLQGDAACENNFECTSNVCVSSKCISESFIRKVINWFKKLFG